MYPTWRWLVSLGVRLWQSAESSTIFSLPSETESLSSGRLKVILVKGQRSLTVAGFAGHPGRGLCSRRVVALFIIYRIYSSSVTIICIGLAVNDLKDWTGGDAGDMVDAPPMEPYLSHEFYLQPNQRVRQTLSLGPSTQFHRNNSRLYFEGPILVLFISWTHHPILTHIRFDVSQWSIRSLFQTPYPCRYFLALVAFGSTVTANGSQTWGHCLASINRPHHV
ncbi:hypothetical protein DER44DRAFT_28184 [Fusarium oxysporum]|nr:hypothetical protein DER44DRAFT_28184 [Fusarium oxysporum]